MTLPVVEGTATTGDARDSSGTFYDLNIPGTAVSGDQIHAVFTSEYNTGGAFSPGAGWEVVFDVQITAGALDNNVTALYAVYECSGGESGTLTLAVQNAETHAVAWRISGAASVTGSDARLPEYSYSITSSDASPRPLSLIPSENRVNDYLFLASHHSTRNYGVSYPWPDNQGNSAGACEISGCTKTLTELALDDGAYFGGFTSFWTAGTFRIVVYPATDYVHSYDNFPFVEAMAFTDESALTGNQLALNIPGGATSQNEILLAVVGQNGIPELSSSSSETSSDFPDYVQFPSDWIELKERESYDGALYGFAAWKEVDGTEGSTETMTVHAGKEVSAVVYRISQAFNDGVDWRLKEGSAAFDSYRFNPVTPLGGVDNFLWVAVALQGGQKKLVNRDTDYKNAAEYLSSGGNVSLRFMDRQLNAASEGAGVYNTDSEGTYLSFMFAVHSDVNVATNVRETQLAGQMLYEPDTVEGRVTQLVGQLLYRQDTDARVTQLVGQALFHAVPCDLKRAQLWKITRVDGAIYRYTTHDRPLTMAGETYSPCNSLKSTATAATVVGQQGGGDIEIGGLISDTEITERDLANGLFDGAAVEVWRVPWNDATYAAESRRRILKGVLGSTTQNGSQYTAELFTNTAKLAQIPLLDVITPACRFEPGDGKCPLDVAAWTVAGAVQTSAQRVAIYRQSFRQFYDNTPELGGSSSNEFSSNDPLSSNSPIGSAAAAALPVIGGLLTWTSGDNVGIQSEIKDYDNYTFTLWQAMPNEIQPGDAYTIAPGCAKTTDDHTTKFGLDMESFGGFPDVPGDDAIIRGPDR